MIIFFLKLQNYVLYTNKKEQKKSQTKIQKKKRKKPKQEQKQNKKINRKTTTPVQFKLNAPHSK